MIWGYAENGVGFIVGCISTLRPLFRKIFRLGGNDSSMNKLGDEPSGGPYARDRDGLAYLRDAPPAYAGGNKAKTNTAVTSSQLGRKMSTSGDSGTESEEYILHDLSGVDVRPSMNGIHVQRSVHQTFD